MERKYFKSKIANIHVVRIPGAIPEKRTTINGVFSTSDKIVYDYFKARPKYFAELETAPADYPVAAVEAQDKAVKKTAAPQKGAGGNDIFDGLDEITDAGEIPNNVIALLHKEGYTLEQARELSLEKLTAIKGIGSKTAKLIKNG